MCGLLCSQRKYADVCSQFAGGFAVEQPYLTQQVIIVSDFPLQQDNTGFLLCLLMDLLLSGEDHSQADQPNNLAKGPPM